MKAVNPCGLKRAALINDLSCFRQMLSERVHADFVQLRRRDRSAADGDLIDAHGWLLPASLCRT